MADKNTKKVNESLSRAEAVKRIASQRTSYDPNALIAGYNPEIFVSRKGFRIMEQMLRDSQISSILALKKAFLLSPGIDFLLEEETEDRKYQEHLDFIKINFSKMFNGSLLDKLEEMLGAYEYGFSYGEKIYSKGSAKGFNDMFWLKSVKYLYPDSIDFYTDYLGEVNQVVQRGVMGPDLKSNNLTHKKFIHYVNQQKFGNPYGKSDLQKIYREWFLKDTVIKFWGIYLQKYAAPFPVGKVSDTTSPQELDEFLKILESIGQAFAMVIPPGFDVEMAQSATDSSDAYLKAFGALNSSISRGLLVPDLLGFGNELKGGSFALGEKQFELFVNIVLRDQSRIEDTFNEQAIKEIINFNFGPQEVYPVMRFNQFKSDNLKEFLELFLKATQQGMPVTMEDINHFRSKINFPDIKEDAILQLKPVKEEQKEEQKEESKEEAPSTDSSSKGDDSDKEQDSVDEDDGLEKDNDEKDFSKSELRRQPTKYESRVDFIKEDRVKRKEEDQLSNDLARIFMRSKAALKDAIARKNIVEERKYTEIDKLNLKFLGDIKDTMSAGMEGIYSFGYNTGKKEIKAVKNKKNFTAFAASPTDLLVPSAQAKAVADELITARTFQAVGSLKDSILNSTKSTLLNGIEKGASTKQMMKAIDEIFNGVVLGSANSELTSSPALLENIIRTNSNNFYNLGRRQVAREPQNDFIEMFQYSAIIDDRTTERCDQLDMFIARKDDPIWDSITPPNHFQCRSTIRYITKIDIEVDDIKPSPESQADVDKLENMKGGKGFIKPEKPLGPERLSGGKM